jgi:hypothetical protein
MDDMIDKRQIMKLYEVAIMNEDDTIKLYSIAAKDIGLALRVAMKVFIGAHIQSIVERGLVCVVPKEVRDNG